MSGIETENEVSSLIYMNACTYVQCWGSYFENVIYYILLISKSNILQLHITVLEK